MVPPTLAGVTGHAFSAVERQAVYAAIVDEERLHAAHSPRASGLMQLAIDEWTLGRPLSEFVSENGWPAPAPA